MPKTKLFYIFICSLMFNVHISFAQKSPKISKYAVGIQLDFGSSFPNFDIKQNRWKGQPYSAGGMSILLSNKIHQNWTVSTGLGLTAYFLTNKSAFDKYVLDFASPHFITGIGYHFQSRKQENHFRLMGGMQLGYSGELIETFDNYTITIQGKNPIYYFIRPEIAFRKYLKYRMNGTRFNVAYEIGTFFRYNFTSLGAATIVEPNFSVTLEPQGNIVGIYCKFIIPTGRKQSKPKKKPENLIPPIIYNPRSM